MLFYTPEFLAFSLVLLATLGVVTRHEPRKLVLLVASYIFYMWWNPAFIALILFATGVNYALGLAIAREASDARRRLWLIVSVVASLGLLAYFKYSGFLAENTLYVMRTLGFDVHWTSIDVVLPVGISFYVFQTLSYTIDLYRQKLPATTSPLDFALYVAFFPQLVAGPIVRASDFLPQLTRPALIRCDQASFFLLLRGLTKKVLIADNVAILADAVFDRPEAFPSIVIWLAAICFAIQIYCDFSGYSDIAIAIARILGFEIPLNFNHPYLASNPSDFWRRWHISLSSWLRDYLYISLGGNRRGRLRTYVNLMLTMLLGGLWHGASWNFLLWGFVHGILLTAHRCYGDIRRHLDTSYHPLEGPVAKICCIVAMQYFVLLSWIAFRVTDVSDLGVALRKFVFIDMDLRLANIGLGGISLVSTVVLLAAFGVLHGLSARVGHLDRLCGRVSLRWASVSCVLLGFAASLLWPLTDAPFIYFQF